MATPMTADQLRAQLKKWNVRFEEYRDWANHNRNHRGAWGPVNGFMVHHTGSDSPDQRALLYDGLSSLPGPLCHFGIDQEGTVHLVGHGRANHAGSGDPDVLRAVTAEDYGDYPPADNQSSVDGNARFYGVEIWYSGSHAMSDAQYASLRRLAASICDFHGWSARAVIGHGEWGSPGKWDPGISPGQMMDMAPVRADIAASLRSTKRSEEGEEEMTYVDLGMTKPLTIRDPGVWVSLAWDTVWNGPISPGAMAFTGPGRYDVTVDLRITGLAEGNAMQVRVVEDGRSMQPVEVIGTAGQTFGSVTRRNVSSGKAKIMVCWHGAETADGVTITRAELHGTVQP